jgi:hypothetical protein
LFLNEDLEDCVRPLNLNEIDPSIINLRNDPHKHIIHSRNKLEDVVVSLDRLEDRELRVDLYKFFEEHGGQGWFKKVVTSEAFKKKSATIPRLLSSSDQTTNKKRMEGASLIDLTHDGNEVSDAIEVPDNNANEEEYVKGTAADLHTENWGEYEEIDISSLSREKGIRSYFKQLHNNYIHGGGITLA